MPAMVQMMAWGPRLLTHVHIQCLTNPNPNVHWHNTVEHVLPIYTNTTGTHTQKRKKEKQNKIIVQEIETYE